MIGLCVVVVDNRTEAGTSLPESSFYIEPETQDAQLLTALKVTSLSLCPSSVARGEQTLGNESCNLCHTQPPLCTATHFLSPKQTSLHRGDLAGAGSLKNKDFSLSPP